MVIALLLKFVKLPKHTCLHLQNHYNARLLRFVYSFQIIDFNNDNNYVYVDNDDIGIL